MALSRQQRNEIPAREQEFAAVLPLSKVSSNRTIIWLHVVNTLYYIARAFPREPRRSRSRSRPFSLDPRFSQQLQPPLLSYARRHRGARLSCGWLAVVRGVGATCGCARPRPPWVVVGTQWFPGDEGKGVAGFGSHVGHAGVAYREEPLFCSSGCPVVGC